MSEWGQLGQVIFQFLESPVYGSFTRSRAANYSEHRRIITKEDGLLQGQKPLKQIAGLESDTVSLSFKVSALILEQVETSLAGRVATTAGFGGSLAGSAFGTLKEDRRFYTDVDAFLFLLNDMLESQKKQNLIIGENFEGVFIIKSITERRFHFPDGRIKMAEIDMQLEEYQEVKL